MSKKLPGEMDIAIDSLLPGGEGVGIFNDRRVLVPGALPGDKLKVRPLRVTRREVKAEVAEILEPSPLRRVPKEDHCTSCSPWQILDESKQYEYKIALVRKTFTDKAHTLPASEIIITPSKTLWHYRNKMEFSFTLDAEGNLSLALHKRGRFSQYLALETCAIAHNRINETANAVLNVLREKNIIPAQLKYLIIRYSYKEDQCIAVLYVRDEHFPVFSMDHKHICGFYIFYSDPQSPASKMTKGLYANGREVLIEQLSGLALQYHFDSFFQVNPVAFQEVLGYIAKNVPQGKTLVDLYCGVGTIGLFLAKRFERVTGIESDERAVGTAFVNARENAIANATFIGIPAEKSGLEELLTGIDCLVCDPPRSGLHPKVLKALLRTPPKYFLYISCNPLTQAQDFAMLKDIYKVRTFRLFDLYPQTPHVESILILEKKSC